MGKYLIFGATGSIGSKLSENMYESDKEVHLIGRDEEELKKLASKLNFEYSVIDILSDNLSETIKENFGDKNISGIAYCIGSIDLKPLRVSKKEDFKKCLDVNFFPVIEIIKSLQDNLKKNNGSIILFSTVAVKKGFTNHAIISSAKGAIEGLTVSLAAEFAPNIRVNCIAPGFIEGNTLNKILEEEENIKHIKDRIPFKRFGLPEEVVEAIIFLASKNSSYITGSTICVDGGYSIG